MNSRPDDKTWFVALNGKRYGPFTFAALMQAAATGVIDADTGVWRLGWVKWHAARRVPGLVAASAADRHEMPPAAESAVAADSVNASMAASGIVGEQLLKPDVPAVAPTNVPRVLPPTRDGYEVMPSAHRGNRRGAEFTALAVVAVALLVAGAGWGALKFGLLDPERLLHFPQTAESKATEPEATVPEAAEPKATEPKATETAPPARSAVETSSGAPVSADAEPRGEAGVAPSGAVGLPDEVAQLPAVAALRQTDPDAFRRFSRRFLASYSADGGDDAILSVARAALRKSLKRRVAAMPGETLIEITRVYLGYMQGLQTTDPESCVGLSDEGKGARLTANLARAFPDLFARDMAVLTSAAAFSGDGVAAPTAEQARPYLESVFNQLRQQSLRLDLLTSDTLVPTQYSPYCSLVIAFYQAALALPQHDAVDLLRYLYASAAAEPDDETSK